MTHPHRFRRLTAVGLGAALTLGACSQADEGPNAMMPAVEEAATPVSMTPGEGITVTPGRASWSTGYFQNEVFRQLMGELGYDVEDPADNELPVGELIDGIASGDIDMTANGWFPSHLPELERDGPNGDRNLTDATPLGFEVKGGALQGVLADVPTIEANSIESLDQIAEDPELAAIFDGDGNGKADLIGCDEGWGCHTIIDDTIEANGWGETIEQVSGSYDELLAEVVEQAEAGEPVLFYTWTPNASVALLEPGVDVMWLDMTPLPEQVGSADIPPGHCTASPCDMGFPPNDIRVIANNDFMGENPAALSLFQAVAIPLEDIAAQNLLMVNGENSDADIETHASAWINDNRALVDTWLDAARSA